MFMDIQQHDQFLHIRFSQQYSLHYGNSEEFKTQVLENYKHGQTVILDFQKLDFIDSAGLTALISIRKKILATQGSLKIVNIGERIQKLIQITRLHRVFEIYDSLEEAIESSKKKADQSNQSYSYDVKLQVEHTESYSLIKIEQPDSLIAANCQQFRDKIKTYLQKSDIIILNFDNLCNIDSEGIATLIHLNRYVREHDKKIFLVFDNQVLTRLFKLHFLDDLFPQFQTDEEAINAAESVALRQQVSPEQTLIVPESETVSDSESEFSDIHFLSSWKKMRKPC
ncbi:hypothetical protein DRP98_07380 [candidate division KSB1 bacterium]|nr:MAG: hypothetical protein DRP98_07380 [candidate division KSB1 bacterium]